MRKKRDNTGAKTVLILAENHTSREQAENLAEKKYGRTLELVSTDCRDGALAALSGDRQVAAVIFGQAEARERLPSGETCPQRIYSLLERLGKLQGVEFWVVIRKKLSAVSFAED